MKTNKIPRLKSVLLVLVATALLLVGQLAPQLYAQTPADLDAVIEKFKTETNPEVRLDLSYEGLDKYAAVEEKSKIDRTDRNTLSDMKRVLLFDLMRQGDDGALVTAIGSGGLWLVDPSMVKNDYDERDDNAVTEYKHKGYYMEGMSDLDFVIMGPQARAFVSRMCETLATGRKGVGLGEAELEDLEMSLVVDEQIRELSSASDRRKFWKQMLNLRASSYHPQKYITKGGKALYCVEHLWERGAAVVLGPKPDALKFSKWSAAAKQDIGPFTAQYLYGGCADMDYFLREALRNTKQERMKTFLQAVKYLERQAWILDAARENADKLPDGLQILPDRIAFLRGKAIEIGDFVEKALSDGAWKSDGAFGAFREGALKISGDICLTCHDLTIAMGRELLFMADTGKLTEGQAVVLDEIAYDLDTVHRARYAHGRPEWYEGHEYTVKKDTLDFLADYRERQPKVNTVLVKAGVIQPEEERMPAIEAGPVTPAPVATVRVVEITMAPEEAWAGRGAEFTVSCELGGIIKGEPKWDEGWLTPEQLATMERLAVWSWLASVQRMKISCLMNTDQANRTTAAQGDWTFISPYEIADISKEDLDECQDEVAKCAAALGLAVPRQEMGKFRPKFPVEGTTMSLEDYITTFEQSYGKARDIMLFINAQASAGSTIAQQATGTSQFRHEMSEAAKTLQDLRDESGAKLDQIDEILGNIKKYKGYVDSFNSIVGGDVSEMSSKAAELSEYLDTLAYEAEIEAIETTIMQNRLVDSIYAVQTWLEVIPKSRAPRANEGALKTLSEWHTEKNNMIVDKIPDLQERAKWLRRGKWAAVTAQYALDLYKKVQEYRDAYSKLDESSLSGQTMDAVIALKACGDIISWGADKIPLSVLSQAIKDYASLLSDAPKWATAFDKMQEERYQGQDYEVRAVLLPAAYDKLIHSEQRLTPELFTRYNGPFARYNGLTIFTHPFGPVVASPSEPTRVDARGAARTGIGKGQVWLIWSKSDPNGFMKLDGEAFRKASLYTAWYRRVYGKPISGPELHDLLVNEKIEGGMFVRRTITPEMLQRDAETALRLLALKDYLGTVLDKSGLEPDELRRYYAMLDQAARLMAKEGLIIGNSDIDEILTQVRTDPPVGGGWDNAIRAIPLVGGGAPEAINTGWEVWDSLSSGEKSRLASAVAERIKKKKEARAKAREEYWRESTRDAPAGLTLDKVRIVYENKLTWENGTMKASGVVKPNGEKFTFKWSTTLPPSAEGDSILVCRVAMLGFDKTAHFEDLTFRIVKPTEPTPPKAEPKKEEALRIPQIPGGEPDLPIPPEPTQGAIPAGAKKVLTSFQGHWREEYQVDGKMVPPVKEWWDNERTRLKEEWIGNSEGRVHKSYNEAGALVGVITYKGMFGEVQHGLEVHCYPDGKKKEQEVWIDGQRRAYSSWRPDGKPALESIEGFTRKRERSWYPNGNIEDEENFGWDAQTKIWVKDGKYILWNENGRKTKEEEYKGDVKHGKCTEWKDNGTPIYEQEWKEGKPYGQLNRYWEDGKKKEEARYKEGKRDGPQKTWNSRGILTKDQNYKDGKLDGRALLYTEEGKLYKENNHKNGQYDGVQITYYIPEGTQKEKEENYKDGKRHGDYKEWRKDGTLLVHIIYRDGQKIETIKNSFL